jgi:RimJ/RimL family protein N-acetyltransferase
MLQMLVDRFPQTVNISGEEFTFRLMTEKDHHAILALARQLSESDLLFMRRDITQPEAIDDWVQDIQTNHAVSILVEDHERIVAYGTLYYNQFFWNRHLGEIRIMVGSPYRNRGLGKRLARELTVIARSLELEKVLTYMSVEDLGARHLFEDLKFRPEAILADWVKTRDERTQDLLIMSISLTEITD